MAGKPVEADLYPPVRAYLRALGYEVKAEVHRCDVVARRTDDEPFVVVELKLALSLDLLLQGIDRQSLTDRVYLAVPAEARRRGRVGWRRWRRLLGLLKRLGLGLLVVHDMANANKARVEVIVEPADLAGPKAPRRQRRRSTRLMTEFADREGDPNIGGVTRRKVVTAYRQGALRCARLLAANGPTALKEIRAGAEVQRAGVILQRDHYGWFVRCERGVYDVNAQGREALLKFGDALPMAGDSEPG